MTGGLNSAERLAFTKHTVYNLDTMRFDVAIGNNEIVAGKLADCLINAAIRYCSNCPSFPHWEVSFLLHHYHHLPAFTLT